MGVDIEILGGIGVIGMQLNFTAIPTSLFHLYIFGTAFFRVRDGVVAGELLA